MNSKRRLVNEHELGQKRIKIAVKSCSKCGESKPFDQYYANKEGANGLQPCCKSCDCIAHKAYKNTQAGFLTVLLRNAKYTTQKRNKQGRGHKFTLTMDKLLKLIADQDGKCAISGAVLVFRQFSDNQTSLDRIDDTLGYVDDNCRLVCLEFNTVKKWSREILVESIALSGVPNDDFDDETADLSTVMPKGYAKGTVQRKWTEFKEDGKSFVFCHFCSTKKPRQDFLRKLLSHGCKSCRAKRMQRRDSTWRGALQQLIRNAKKNTKTRNKRRGTQIECTLTYVQLVDILKAQGGMCAYSRVMMTPRGKWNVSLERKDVRSGYSAKNVFLVCQRFNAIDKSVEAAEGTVNGSGGWSREKFLRYAALITS